MSWMTGASLPASDVAPDADVNKAAELLAAEGPPWDPMAVGATSSAAAAVPAAAPRTAALGVRRGSGVTKAAASPALARACTSAEVEREAFKEAVAASAAAGGAASASASAPAPAVPMTEEEEKAAKYEARLKMNRKSAKASRIRRQSYLKQLEGAVTEMEALNAKLQAAFDACREENAQLRASLEVALQASAGARPAAAPAVAAAPSVAATVEEAAAAAIAGSAVGPGLLGSELEADLSMGWADAGALGELPDLLGTDFNP